MAARGSIFLPILILMQVQRTIWKRKGSPDEKISPPSMEKPLFGKQRGKG